MNDSKFQINLDRNFVWRLFFAIIAMFLVINSVDIAMAADATGGTTASANSNDAVGQALCRIMTALSGGVARAIAAAAIFVVGVSLFLGKVSWVIALPTTIGIVLVFGAGKIVAFISGNNADSVCPTN